MMWHDIWKNNDNAILSLSFMIQYFLMYVSMDGTEVLLMYWIFNGYCYYLFRRINQFNNGFRTFNNKFYIYLQYFKISLLYENCHVIKIQSNFVFSFFVYWKPIVTLQHSTPTTREITAFFICHSVNDYCLMKNEHFFSYGEDKLHFYDMMMMMMMYVCTRPTGWVGFLKC